jgi:hypothetical protein
MYRHALLHICYCKLVAIITGNNFNWTWSADGSKAEWRYQIGRGSAIALPPEETCGALRSKWGAVEWGDNDHHGALPV